MATEGIFLTINDQKSLELFIKGAAANGMIRSLNPQELIQWMRTVEFPIQVPVDFDKVLATAGNPIVKKVFGKKIDETFTRYVKTAMEAR